MICITVNVPTAETILFRNRKIRRTKFLYTAQISAESITGHVLHAAAILKDQKKIKNYTAPVSAVLLPGNRNALIP